MKDNKGSKKDSQNANILDDRVRRLESILGVPDEESTTEPSKTIQDRILQLEEFLGDTTTKLEINDQVRQALVAGIQTEVEAKLTSAPLFRFGRWLLGVAMSLGILIWIGGTWSGFAQIKSIRQSADAASKQMETEVSEVKRRADELIGKVITEELSTRVKTAVEDANKFEAYIDKKREEVDIILSTVTVDDVAKINQDLADSIKTTITLKKKKKEQLADLEQLDQVLGVPTRIARVVWVALGASVLALLLSFVSACRRKH